VTTSARPQPKRSAFAAAFLSFLFPGLGQAYAGAYVRGLALAAPLLLGILAAVAAVAINGVVWFGLWISQTSVLGPIAFLNIALGGYRAFAALDAYRLQTPPADPAQPIARRVGTRSGQIHPASIAGLIAILVVLVSGHVFVSYWDLRLYKLEEDISKPVVIEESTPEPGNTEEPVPSVSFPPQMTFEPAPTVQPWTGKGRLNVLLVGVDQSSGFRTDTMMVVSVDPSTHGVAMFSIPRDTTGVPMPPKSRLSQLWGSVYPYKLNTLWKNSDKYRSLFPNGGVDALEQALGYLFFGDQGAIQTYVLVDFQGFQKVVDTFGGVTINVPYPIVDNSYPGNSGNGHSGLHYRVFIPAGIQHMNGDQALTYARSRHGTSDYDRASRQQRVLIALEQEANIDEISSHLSQLIDDLSSTIHTDILKKLGPDKLATILQLAKSIKPNDIQSYVFGGPTYLFSGYVPNVTKIRATVKAVVSGQSVAPDPHQVAVDENAPILVENGTATAGQDTDLAAYLQSIGFDAQASASQPAQLGGITRLLCVNGADIQYPATFAELESTLGLSGTPSADSFAAVRAVSDPTQDAGFVIVTGTNLPGLSPPPD
jgi:LCP family protein required for cell wall assembly